MAREFLLIVVTPTGAWEPSLAIAASRAGELGVLDLEYARDHERARQAAARLARHAHNPYGLKLHCQQAELLADLLVDSAADLRLVLLTGHDPQLLRQHIATLHARGVRVLLESSNADHARWGEALGVDGIVAKGHEAGGHVGQETTFILLQKCLKRLTVPIYAQGGIGLHTAAACYAAGAAGVILDAQLSLTRESQLPVTAKALIAAMDGSETICLGGEIGHGYRVYFRPGLPAVEALRREAAQLADAPLSPEERRAAWRQAIGQRVGWTEDPNPRLLPLGQEAAFAAPLARRFVTVSGVLSAIRTALATHCESALRLRPLDQGAPLAQSHHTRYPIVQGPMTRVSDKATFAVEVAKAGALPFLALALMRTEEVVPLLEETRRALEGRTWGVGILGFVPQVIRDEQLQAIRLVRPSCALIAGGRPDQARVLEEEGIPTYLHVPSPVLLNTFLAQGARRFVFEGRECGGHVGPRSSFVLWETMVDILHEHVVRAKDQAQEYHLLFAGGVHDSISASMVAVLAAPLAELGVRLGVLMGTAYLFTKEAVSTGAIAPGFQAEAVRAEQTVLLEAGPGHATRCLPTPYARAFVEHKRQLLQEGLSGDELREALEALNLGRLRIATRGIARHPRYGQDPGASKYITLDPRAQRDQGMFMIGQVAALRDQVITLESLHQDVAIAGSARLPGLVEPPEASSAEVVTAQPSRIAVVGMSCILPGAKDLAAYWENILLKVDAVTEVPRERWDWRRYFDPDQTAPDRIYSRWGGFIDEVPFDPLDYGMPPNAVSSIEPLQLLMLEAVRAALDDAGYLERPFPRERTGVILGVGGGLGDLGYLYGFRAYLPHFLDSESSATIARLSQQLPTWTEDSFPGILLNVAAGRIANRFDLGGPNFTVDAACGSSLAALDVAIKDLEAQRTDMAIVGAGDTVQSPFAFLAFSKTQALSPTGRCRPFDANADGIAISEGLAVVILKRLEDAERDGDRIYAIIQAVGASSDGRDKGLTAPRPAGQLRALRRAYAKAGVPAASVGLIEAHGTGTRVGDPVEMEALREFFRSAPIDRQYCGVGSVKSMIGHTKSTAGLAGVIKVALALHHKVLPPTLVDEPNPKFNFAESPFYVNTEVRPWLTHRLDAVRRAGVSAFGFGGTNFHAVLEEYRGDYLPAWATSQAWPSELLIWQAQHRADLVEQIQNLEHWLSAGNKPLLRDLAFSLHLRYAQATHAETSPTPWVLAIIASSLEGALQKLVQARTKLLAGEVSLSDAGGLFFAQRPLSHPGKVAFLFPGQGSQYPNMLRDLAVHFPRVRECFERANHALEGRLPSPLTDLIFPVPAHSDEATRAMRQALTATRVAQPALGAAGLALSALLKDLGVRPAMAAGHSYGEIVALCEAGVVSETDLLLISEARGRFMAEAAGPESGTMAAVAAGPEAVAATIDGLGGLTLANLNAPQQTVISGPVEDVKRAMERFQDQGIVTQILPVACAFHSPLVEGARRRLAELLETIEFRSPQIEVFANATAGPYPSAPSAIRDTLAGHMVRPVAFQKEIEALYAAGARLFIEVGPRNVLSRLVDQILVDRPHAAIAMDQPGEAGLTAMQLALGQLAASGWPVRLDLLYEGRHVHRLDFSHPYESPAQTKLRPTTWMVGGGRARPWRDAQGPGRELGVIPLSVRLADEADNGGPTRLEYSRSNDGPPAPEALAPASTASSTPARPRDGHEADEVSQVMLEYQQLMRRFLEAQHDVMLAYLHAESAAAKADAMLSASPPDPLTSGSASRAETDPRLQSPTAAPSAAAVPSAQATSPRGAPDAATLMQELLTIVSERTGYPADMLQWEADLEADLGIDSIKRIEILSTLRARHPELQKLLNGPGMEQLQAQKTLRAIVDWAVSRLAGAQDPGPAQAEDLVHAGPPSADPSDSILRYVFASSEAPAAHARAPLAPDRTVLVTEDGRGVSQAVAEALRAQGRTVVRVAAGREVAKLGDDWYAADLTRPQSVDQVLELIRQERGPFGCLVHLIPLSEAQDFERLRLDEWRAQLRHEVVSLLHLIRSLQGDLLAAAKGGGACVLAATDRGGALIDPGRGAAASFVPARGGVAGLLKTMAHEVPAIRARLVELDVHQGTDHAVQAILHELGAGDPLLEVSYSGAVRLTSHLTPSRLSINGTSTSPIDSHSVLLVTGGARGITALVARALAARYRPTLALVGRSPLPAPQESPHTAGLTSARALKEALFASLSAAGQAASLADVEVAYRRLLREREVRDNLAAMRRAGATVRYDQVDVRDESAFGALLDELYRVYGRLDGVIHGAGVIEDKLIRDKSPASFERVVSTKADSAFILSRKLRPQALRFLVFFSSVSGAFGNKGQGDYAAANAILNKLAIYLDRRWAARVVSINWGPWDAPGMITPELRQEYRRRGISLIPAAIGQQRFLEELDFGGKGDAEVLICAEDGVRWPGAFDESSGRG